MAGPIITVERASKRYRLGTGASADQLLTERLGGALRAVGNRFRSQPRGRAESKPANEELWALRDVSLSIERGEVVGLIGRNGGGKSTLLKLLSQITPPTTGRITLNGRVATLLEVGTGFHPELTGRENVYLNGTILGMRRTEVDSHFDEIVEFAGLGRFLNTPVKRYSSGMYVRLAFAVAAHLQPEILLVDEVLAVGDTEFQAKCLGKMHDVADQEGRTIIFVSHNLHAVQRLCRRTYWIEKGEIAEEGLSEAVVNAYVSVALPQQEGGTIVVGDSVARRGGSGEVRFEKVSLLDAGGAPVSRLWLGQSFSVATTIDVKEPVDGAVFEFGINTLDGLRVATVQSNDANRPPFSFESGAHEVRADLGVVLLPGTFTVEVAVRRSNGEALDHLDNILRFSTLAMSEDGADRYEWENVRGFVRPSSKWNVAPVDQPLPVPGGP